MARLASLDPPDVPLSHDVWRASYHWHRMCNLCTPDSQVIKCLRVDCKFMPLLHPWSDSPRPLDRVGLFSQLVDYELRI